MATVQKSFITAKSTNASTPTIDRTAAVSSAKKLPIAGAAAKKTFTTVAKMVAATAVKTTVATGLKSMSASKASPTTPTKTIVDKRTAAAATKGTVKPSDAAKPLTTALTVVKRVADSTNNGSAAIVREAKPTVTKSTTTGAPTKMSVTAAVKNVAKPAVVVHEPKTQTPLVAKQTIKATTTSTKDGQQHLTRPKSTQNVGRPTTKTTANVTPSKNRVATAPLSVSKTATSKSSVAIAKPAAMAASGASLRKPVVAKPTVADKKLTTGTLKSTSSPAKLSSKVAEPTIKARRHSIRTPTLAKTVTKVCTEVQICDADSTSATIVAAQDDSDQMISPTVVVELEGQPIVSMASPLPQTADDDACFNEIQAYKVAEQILELVGTTRTTTTTTTTTTTSTITMTTTNVADDIVDQRNALLNDSVVIDMSAVDMVVVVDDEQQQQRLRQLYNATTNETGVVGEALEISEMNDELIVIDENEQRQEVCDEIASSTVEASPSLHTTRLEQCDNLIVFDVDREFDNGKQIAAPNTDETNEWTQTADDTDPATTVKSIAVTENNVGEDDDSAKSIEIHDKSAAIFDQVEQRTTMNENELREDVVADADDGAAIVVEPNVAEEECRAGNEPTESATLEAKNDVEENSRSLIEKNNTEFVPETIAAETCDEHSCNDHDENEISDQCFSEEVENVAAGIEVISPRCKIEELIELLENGNSTDVTTIYQNTGNNDDDHHHRHHHDYAKTNAISIREDDNAGRAAETIRLSGGDQLEETKRNGRQDDEVDEHINIDHRINIRENYFADDWSATQQARVNDDGFELIDAVVANAADSVEIAAVVQTEKHSSSSSVVDDDGKMVPTIAAETESVASEDSTSYADVVRQPSQNESFAYFGENHFAEIPCNRLEVCEMFAGDGGDDDSGHHRNDGDEDDEETSHDKVVRPSSSNGFVSSQRADIVDEKFARSVAFVQQLDDHDNDDVNSNGNALTEVENRLEDGHELDDGQMPDEHDHQHRHHHHHQPCVDDEFEHVQKKRNKRHNKRNRKSFRTFKNEHEPPLNEIQENVASGDNPPFFKRRNNSRRSRQSMKKHYRRYSEPYAESNCYSAPVWRSFYAEN